MHYHQNKTLKALSFFKYFFSFANVIGNDFFRFMKFAENSSKNRHLIEYLGVSESVNC